MVKIKCIRMILTIPRDLIHKIKWDTNKRKINQLEV